MRGMDYIKPEKQLAEQRKQMGDYNAERFTYKATRSGLWRWLNLKMIKRILVKKCCTLTRLLRREIRRPQQ